MSRFSTASLRSAVKACASFTGSPRQQTEPRIKNLIPMFNSKNIRDADANGANHSLIPCVGAPLWYINLHQPLDQSVQYRLMTYVNQWVDTWYDFK